MSEKLIDKHIFIPESVFEKLKRECYHKGDLSFIINKAIAEWLERRESDKLRQQHD